MTIPPSEVASAKPPAAPLPTAEGRALRICALFAAAIILWITHPVGIGVLLGTLSAFPLLPLYYRLRSRWRRPALAALVCVLVTTLGAVSAVAGFIYLLIWRGIVLIRVLIASLQPGGGLRVFLESQNARLPRMGV